ncbi:MAG: response regulator [Candidatus Omnitrophota bacterium]
MDKKKILVADDDKVTLKLVEHSLTNAGYDVVFTEDGNQVIGLVKKEKPNLILLDIFMPGMHGTEIGQALRNDPEAKNIPIIYLTSLFTKDDERRMGHIISGNLFIAKPFNTDDLLRMVQEHIL